MQLPLKISNNLHFLIAEVSLQISNLHSYFDNHSPILKKRILDRSGYVYNLKAGIHNSCLTQYSEKKLDSNDQILLKSIELIATDLGKIADHCRECVKKSQQINKKYFKQIKGLKRLVRQVELGLTFIEPAVIERKTELAIKISRIQKKIYKDSNHLSDYYITHLKKKKETTSLINTLFVINEIEHMGEKLLNISESILSANLGHPINFERYFSLQSSLEQVQLEQNIENNTDIQIETIAETRSGSIISGLSTEEDSGKYLAVYKDGKTSKLKQERKGVESWEAIQPGIAPKILSYNKQGKSASLLIEHLDGLTFEQILLNSSNALLKKALKHLNKTLRTVWKGSKRMETVNALFMQQLLSRLDDVYSVHPEFLGSTEIIADQAIPSFSTLIKQAEKVERQLPAPFSVYIHGDFNLDNIIYEPEQQRINYIDLHRSCYMDYVQDVSVLMISNYRMQIFDSEIRQKILTFAYNFYCCARQFAKKNHDTTFELRLALGLARSFVTSTRFILDKTLARAMFYRARYIIERVLEADLKRPEKFNLPIEEIFIG